MVNKNELMIGDIFEIKLNDKVFKAEILKIGNKQVDISLLDLDNKEGVCLMDSLIPQKLDDNMLINDYKFQKRNLKINGETINDIFKMIGDYFISLVKNGEKYNLSIKSINGENICDSYNIEYLHTLQNIIKSNIKLEINT